MQVQWYSRSERRAGNPGYRIRGLFLRMLLLALAATLPVAVPVSSDNSQISSQASTQASTQGDGSQTSMNQTSGAQIDQPPSNTSGPASPTTSASARFGNQASLLSIEGAIGPALEDYFSRALEDAVAQSSSIVIVYMDTPGGLDAAMREMIKQITASPVPVATYVAPTGARAASAGTYILYASHIAAMAPGTNLGAATPVAIGGISLPGSEEEEGGEGAKNAMEKKIINDASAYIRGLAELHGRNVEWAELAVREAVSLEASEALRMNVIDVIAGDVDDLLRQIDGREVLVEGKKQVLHTAGLPVIHIEPDWRSRILMAITNPNVAYILMMVGIYGLILEFYNPGGLVPGVVGAICLILALYAMQMLPVNYAGMGLILLGVGLMVAEAFQPSFGMLGIGGLVAFVFGSIILLETDIPGFRIYLSVIATFAVVSALVFVVLVGLALKARSRPVVSGAEQLIGKEVKASEDFLLQDNSGYSGSVFIYGEIWSARCASPLLKNQEASVVAVEGLTLYLESAEEVTGSEKKTLSASTSDSSGTIQGA